MSTTQAREEYSFLSAIPDLILRSVEWVEDQQWWASVKRRQTLKAQGKKPGRMPRFRSRGSDQTFVCFHNNGKKGLLRFWLSPRLLRSGERSWKDNGHADQVQRGVQA